MPLLQIPITALDTVIDSISPEYMSLEADDPIIKGFLEGAFALKLKEEFLCLYVDNFTHNGLEGELKELAKLGKLRLDQNTEELVKYYKFLERKTLKLESNNEVHEMDNHLEPFF